VFTLIDERRAVEVPATLAGATVCLAPDVVRDALGWELTEEGLCGHGLCVPVPEGARLLGPDGVDLAALARLLDRPLALDLAERVACLGAPAAERASALSALVAPDFALPDLGGRTHTLGAHRGRKVLLVVWASW
jgi:hypothetical protein